VLKTDAAIAGAPAQRAFAQYRSECGAEGITMAGIGGPALAPSGISTGSPAIIAANDALAWWTSHGTEIAAMTAADLVAMESIPAPTLGFPDWRVEANAASREWLAAFLEEATALAFQDATKVLVLPPLAATPTRLCSVVAGALVNGAAASWREATALATAAGAEATTTFGYRDVACFDGAPLFVELAPEGDDWLAAGRTPAQFASWLDFVDAAVDADPEIATLGGGVLLRGAGGATASLEPVLAQLEAHLVGAPGGGGGGGGAGGTPGGGGGGGGAGGPRAPGGGGHAGGCGTAAQGGSLAGFLAFAALALAVRAARRRQASPLKR
jgi:hypothetical protein